VWALFVAKDQRPDNPPASTLTSSYLRHVFVSAVYSNVSQDQMTETAAHMSHTLTTAETHYDVHGALELTSRTCKLFCQHLCSDNPDLNTASGLLCSSDDDDFENTHVEHSKSILAVRRGRSLVGNAVFTSDNQLVSELLQHMRDDDVKTIVMSDELICREAGLRMAALGNKTHQKRDDKYRVRQVARTLGRIVQLARETVPNATLTSLIEPQHLDLMVDVAKKLPTDKETH